ncbi:CBS domain-containing protein [Anaeromyxobacter diazotrophicus]|uniref:Inosine-5-monophosphate dehydrogenase n=1 Tax=Anaeromyxobacter diazotrophicus TaxID=2590199 RepID=A0A7I9VSX9_9BACT|nr:CBS domain-containing protein [Anaeromyxobacter diazotrophicus]GEJ59328.1 inosine-5-monophosphate dehydrogenase [Anaeromyxobacter diazotrophicus]
MATIENHVVRDLVALEGGASCAEAARLMSERGIGAIAVRDGGRVVGVVTERDLVARVLAEGLRPELPIRQAMRTDVPLVTPSTTELDCTALMRDHTTRHLLVAERGEVVGIISMRDVIRLMLDEKEWLIGQLHTFIDGRDFPAAAAG